MAVAELSLVTETVERLLRTNIEHRHGNTVTVNTTSVAPSNVNPTARLVNIYLYHLHEEGRPTIADNPTISDPSPRFYEKTLTLYFHLTTHHNAAALAHLVEQDLLGHALATLADYKTLNDDTMIGPISIFNLSVAGRANQFEIEMQTKTDVEALNVWAVYDGQTVQPSLYFKLKNVRIEAETPTSLAGPVLSIGQMVVPNLGPRIFSIRSQVTADLHTQGGIITRQFDVEPAEIYIGAGPSDNNLVLRGQSMDVDSVFELELPNAGDGIRARVDIAANGALGWSQSVANGQVSLQTSDVLQYTDGLGVQNFPLEPGSATIRFFAEGELDREDQQIAVEMPSNRYALTLHPHIASVTVVAPAANREFRITFNGAYDLTTMIAMNERADMVRFTFANQVCEMRTDNAAPTAGQCAITGARTINFVAHTDADLSQTNFIRVWIRDSASQPFWIVGV